MKKETGFAWEIRIIPRENSYRYSIGWWKVERELANYKYDTKQFKSLTIVYSVEVQLDYNCFIIQKVAILISLHFDFEVL